MNNDCIVLIPYYKNDLTIYEKYSLDKGLKILAKYSISFLSPEDLDISVEYRDINVQCFNKKYFQSLQGYNQLLLSEHFYKKFLEYKYLLIYQLDALVFKDELEYWCSLDYDYYGAPWNRKTWKFKYFNLFGLLNTKVGNGGFSLRKTATFYMMSKKIIKVRRFIKFGEDIFWCNFGKLFYRKFNLIDYNLAIRFAFETDPQILFTINNNQLPFGCHAYEKNNFLFWKELLLDVPGK